MSSAILYAWFRTNQPPQDAFPKIYVPLLYIPREDINLRPEFKAVFEQCGIDTDNLTTLSDLPSSDQLPIEQTEWVLVDRNKLDGELGATYSSRVVGCIDHHDEEDVVPRHHTSEPRVVEVCGSCTSLVFRELATKISGQSSGLDAIPSYTSDALKLGLASILIDTNNLQDKNKTTTVDVDVANYLDRALTDRIAGWNRTEFFDKISAAKQNLDGMSLNDILRKDYKQWTEGSITLGMSSIVRDLDFLTDLSRRESMKKDSSSLWSEISSRFVEERALDIWAIMTAYLKKGTDGKERFERQLRIYWRDDKSAEIVGIFEKKHGSDLGLELIDSVDATADRNQNWKAWKQSNVAASRKQVSPMLRNVIKQTAQM